MSIKQLDMSIYSKVKLDIPLSDVRPTSYGLRFGSVRSICKQYGIKIVEHEGFTEFIAPKNRLQMLVEKLHFSMNKYSKKPL